MHADEDRLNALSRVVMGCAFIVLNTLGAGFMEKVYENALTLELRKTVVAVTQRHPITVLYDGQTVGAYVADLPVEQALPVELKATKALDQAHRVQCLVT